MRTTVIHGRTCMRVPRWLLLLNAVAMSGCSGPAPIPFKPIVDVKTLMQTVVDPSADVIWDAVATIVTKEGTEDRRPHTPEEWTKLRAAAVTLTEAGNLLMMAPRAYDGDDWMKWCHQLVDVGSAAIRAADKKSADEIFNVGGPIDEMCENCHQEYAYENAPRRKR